MCGIAGWIDFKDDLTQKYNEIEKMSEKLAPRGPDASGLWSSPDALIAHRRLAVVDPSGGAQPMVKSKGDNNYVITYNGELYNTQNLREELEKRGYVFLSSSDTEVLLVSFIEWGARCVEYLNGIYAFSIWNEKEKSLFLARDRFGVKPLFYIEHNGSLIFASELKALLAHSHVKPEVDSEGLAEIFALGPARTPGHGVFKGICEIKPAHCATFDNTGMKISRYWSFHSHPHTDSLDDTISKVSELVNDSIVRQFVADVPVCTFLSGGLDSSAITALAAKYFKSSGKPQLHTYSIDYKDNDIYFKASAFQPDSDESWVKRMAKEFDTQHHYITIDTPQLVEALKGATLAKDLPGMADVDSSLWLFSREIKKNSTVALSGECADEIFGGYPWFHSEDMLNSNTFPWSRFVGERTHFLSAEVKNAIKAEEYISRRYHETLEEVPRLQGEDPLEARRREMFYLNITWFMFHLV